MYFCTEQDSIDFGPALFFGRKNMAGLQKYFKALQ